LRQVSPLVLAQKYTAGSARDLVLNHKFKKIYFYNKNILKITFLTFFKKHGGGYTWFQRWPTKLT
jgi:hypothetical protein